MKKYNVIIVYNKEKTHILMCLRAKEPFKGKYNLVGGKVEAGESSYDAAYRELYEETHITKNDLKIVHFMNMQYLYDDMELEIFGGILNKDVVPVEEVNKLYWLSVNENYFDYDKFAGEGNIGHILRILDEVEL